MPMGEWQLVRANLDRKPKAKGKPTAPATEELFHLATDPAETQNVAAAHLDLVAKMKAIMAAQHTNSADFPLKAIDQ